MLSLLDMFYLVFLYFACISLFIFYTVCIHSVSLLRPPLLLLIIKRSLVNNQVFAQIVAYHRFSLKIPFWSHQKLIED